MKDRHAFAMFVILVTGLAAVVPCSMGLSISDVASLREQCRRADAVVLGTIEQVVRDKCALKGDHGDESETTRPVWYHFNAGMIAVERILWGELETDSIPVQWFERMDADSLPAVESVDRGVWVVSDGTPMFHVGDQGIWLIFGRSSRCENRHGFSFATDEQLEEVLGYLEEIKHEAESE